ncbi:MAG: hypothetical protein ACPGJS_23795 [Flammeovirgaceae bacterium]
MFKSITYSISFALSLLVIMSVTPTQAQEKISLGNHNGISVSYTIQFLGSIEKKKADKSRDEYQITVWTVNNTGKDIFCTSSSTGGARVANAKSTRKTARAAAINAQLITTQGNSLFVFRQGATLQGTAKIRTQKGVEPVVTYDQACNFQALANYDIQASAGLVNGSWKVENGTTAMQLTFIAGTDGAEATINQQAPDGKIVVWYRVGPKTFQRALSGSSKNLNDATVDANQTYTAKITFIGMNRIQYTNTEGITINWIKQ